jgi:hypothetical protein
VKNKYPPDVEVDAVTQYQWGANSTTTKALLDRMRPAEAEALAASLYVVGFFLCSVVLLAFFFPNAID